MPKINPCSLCMSRVDLKIFRRSFLLLFLREKTINSNFYSSMSLFVIKIVKNNSHKKFTRSTPINEVIWIIVRIDVRVAYVSTFRSFKFFLLNFSFFRCTKRKEKRSHQLVQEKHRHQQPSPNIDKIILRSSYSRSSHSRISYTIVLSW